MPKVLAIESSTKSGSVALVVDGQVIGEQFYHLEKSHSSLLHVMIKEMMRNTGMELKELDCIGLAKGPGSYTGLRIGTSTAKGLCYALDLPLIAINTLEGMAFQVVGYHHEDAYLCPMIDARRMEVYSATWDINMNAVEETAPVILDENAFKSVLAKGRVIFFGDGSAKFQEILEHPNASFLADLNPRAAHIGLLSEKAFEKGEFENVISFEPFYLKEFRTTTPKK